MEMGFLPTIKCSNCGNNVEISAMGDHVCTTIDHGMWSDDSFQLNERVVDTAASRKAPNAPIPSPPPSAGLESPDRLTAAMATKPGRGAPPRIDPSVASTHRLWQGNNL